MEELKMKLRGFEICNKKKNEEVEITLPRRGTSKAMAYDFFSPKTVVVQPGEIAKIWTDVKAKFNDDEALFINVRSSMGKHPVMIANTQGWIESDYYSNADNDGNIGIRLLNLGTEPYIIKRGDRIAQGMFIKYLTADNGNTDVQRTGGFGSSGK